MTSSSFATPHYPWADALPEGAQLITVASGVHWLRLPLPFALDHINVWLLEDPAHGQPGWTLVDCGIATPAVQVCWQLVFDQVLRSAPLHRIVVTHLHPDHVGLATWLAERDQASIWMSATDFAMAHLLCLRPLESARAQTLAHYQRHGVSDLTLLDSLVTRGTETYRQMVPALPYRYSRLREGDLLRIGERDWRVIMGFGHAPEHACLVCERDALLISGDMVLPRISTNLSVGDIEPEANPIPAYLESLSRLRQLPDSMLVLPSHGKPFRGLHARIDALQVHHGERLQATQDACQTASSAYEVMQALFQRPLDAHQLSFAFGETLAHLHWAESLGKVRRLAEQDPCRFLSRP